MKIAILGYGKEGQSAATYFQKQQNQPYELTIFDQFDPAELTQQDFSIYDLVVRSPSLQPQPGWSSVTKYFFAHCPCSIIGVTGTKGKGTTCSFITTILQALGHKVWLVGNIGTPALDVLDQIQPDDIVVYELSSFQLWDLEQSPHVAVVLRIEPDHLNVHKDFNDYLQAKSNIVRHQAPADFCIYNQQNSNAAKIAKLSTGTKIAYPEPDTELEQILNSLSVPGQHNRENAEAALRAVAAYLEITLADLLTQHHDKIATALRDFQGLPHHLQFLREVNGVKYYDDNFSASFPALDVALAAFPDQPIILIAGGKDRGIDPHPAKARIFKTRNLVRAFLIGETSHALADGEDQTKYVLCASLNEAFSGARKLAESIAQTSPDQIPIVLMSPGAPSFDMFKNFVDRGEQFQQLVQEINSCLDS